MGFFFKTEQLERSVIKSVNRNTRISELNQDQINIIREYLPNWLQWAKAHDAILPIQVCKLIKIPPGDSVRQLTPSNESVYKFEYPKSMQIPYESRGHTYKNQFVFVGAGSILEALATIELWFDPKHPRRVTLPEIVSRTVCAYESGFFGQKRVWYEEQYKSGSWINRRRV